MLIRGNDRRADLLLVLLAVWSMALGAAPVGQSLFDAGRTGSDSGPEGNFYELGTVFRTSAAGTITHLRVYALASETGDHVARVWRNATEGLVAGPFTWSYGGATGWITLDVPDFPIEPDTDYTVSVSTGGGGRSYPIRTSDLAQPGGNGLNLGHPAGAGVFATAAGVRPTQTFQNANYYRDVVFVPGSIEPPVDAPVRINEFLAINDTGLADEDGDHSDWIELYNPSGVPKALGGYQLLSGGTNWIFPELTLGAQQFLIVFASGKNRTNPAAPLHTNFKLDGAGEYLALRDASNTVVSEFAPGFVAQRADYSCGPGTNGESLFYYTPTPGGPNGPSFQGFLEEFAFSAGHGFHEVPLQVAITNIPAGATVHYTLNGSTPTETNATYTTPLLVGSTTTLRARAFRPGFLSTKVHTATYLFPADVLTQTPASAEAYGWPRGPVNGQEFRLGIKPVFAALYTPQQMLAALRQVPSISIVTDQRHLTDPATGLYVNPAGTGMAWEKPASIELLQPDGSGGFQEDCGLRIRGGQSSSTSFPKHSFHVFFSRDYGSPRLKYPLFGADGAAEFDTIDLRCEHGYAYADPYPYSDEYTAIRDVFCRDLWRAAGYASTRSRPYHLYINGQYWGLYQTQERAQEDYGSTYFGGAPEEYDTIKATGLPQLTIEASSGDFTSWRQLWTGAREVAAHPTDANYFALLGRNAGGVRDPSLPVLLDPHELAAYMLLHYYTGHADEPLSISFNWEKPNNFRALRRHGMDDPFHFFVHDAESSMLAPEWSFNRALVVNLTSPNRSRFEDSNPEWIHEDLMANPEYRIAFADEAQRLLFNDGPFTPARAQEIWDGLAAEIDQAVIGESIRWGVDVAKARQSVWAARIAQVRSSLFPSRTATVIAQLRQRGQYPMVAAPALNQYGGIVPPGFELVLTNSAAAGTLYYAFGGEDPRGIGGGISPAALAYSAGTAIPINGPVTLKARTLSGTTWSALTAATFYTLQDFTRLVISEIMYDPPDAGSVAGDNFEFLELKNTGTNAMDLSGVAFTEGISFTFPTGSLLAPGGFFVLGRNPDALTNKYPGLVVNGVYTGKLNNTGEQLTLNHTLGGRILSFGYKDSGRWPLTPAGWGFSLVPRDTAFNPDPGSPFHWRASTHPGGSPGLDDPSPVIPPVLVNEALTSSTPPALDAIELFNPTPVEVDLGGWYLTDDPTRPTKFRIPEGTLLAPGGFRIFTEAEFNARPLTDTNSFALSAAGDQVYLFSGDAQGRLTGYSHGFAFEGADDGVSFGRHVTSTGDEHFIAQIRPSLGSANTGPRVGPIVIRQLMYHPIDRPSGLDDAADEFIELRNISADPVNLYDPGDPSNTWQLRGGVRFDFPPSVTLPPDGSVVLVGFDPAGPTALAGFRARYSQFRTTPVMGPFSGRLDNSRDTILLSRAGTPQSGVVPRILVDELAYLDAAPWPALADGGGGSLLRIRSDAYGNDPINWSSSVPLTLLLQPADISVRPGSNVVFSVEAAGNGPLSYQWLHDGVAIPGQTSSTLSLTNVQVSHRGDYYVTVADANATGTSLAARLTVLIPPTVAVQPQSVTAVAGDTVQFSITVSNTASLPIGFRWRRNASTEAFYELNAFTSVLTLTNVSTNVNFSVLLTNVANVSGVSSAIAILTVLADSDGDHLPDVWMMQSFGHTNALASDLSRAGDDPDGDSVSNLNEYLAGTDPQDGASRLRVSIEWDASAAAVTFLAVSNHAYTVQSRASLTEGSWTGLRTLESARTNRTVHLVDPGSSGEARFYRVTTP